MWTNRILEEMNRFLVPIGFESSTGPTTRMPYPPLNVWEDGENLYLEAELPGLVKEQIDISVLDGTTLTIASERKPRTPEKSTWLRQECGYGRFTRTFTLPTAINADAINATYENGVLTLTLPKHENARPKKIAVKTAPSAVLTDGHS